jgi:NTP pyrophosphatase (non-canonical NTP hydrolase)
MNIKELIEQSHGTAVEKGWWDGGERSAGDQFTNFHGEVSEAWEEWRKYGWNPLAFLYTSVNVDENGRLAGFSFDSTQKPEGVAAEFADILIRIADTCGKYEIPLEAALVAKMNFNRTRPHRHGGKLA